MCGRAGDFGIRAFFINFVRQRCARGINNACARQTMGLYATNQRVRIFNRLYVESICHNEA